MTLEQHVSVMRTKERILVERAANESPLIALGFQDVINQDGTDVTWEYGMPQGTGYGYNCDMMEVRSQQAQVFVPEGPDFDIGSKSWRFSVDMFGNVAWNPKFFIKLTAYNGMTIDTNAPFGLVGINWEGKEFVFEPDGPYVPATAPQDPNGRPIRVKVVRNRSAVNLKPGRLVHYDESGNFNLETGVDGYCYQLADRPAGIVDEYLPAAGVPPNDLFYIVIDGPSKVTNQHASPITAAVGNRLVPAATGTGRTDDLAGRVALQDLTGATATLANNIQNCLGFVAVANNAADAQFAAVIDTHDD